MNEHTAGIVNGSFTNTTTSDTHQESCPTGLSSSSLHEENNEEPQPYVRRRENRPSLHEDGKTMEEWRMGESVLVLSLPM